MKRLVAGFAVGLVAAGVALGQAAAGVKPLGPESQAPEDKAVVGAEGWIGRSLILRGFYGDDNLKFDVAGKVEGSPKVVDWTLAGMDIASVKRLSAGEIELDGVRVAMRYNPDAQTFDRNPLKDRPMKVVVATGAPVTQESVMLALDPVDLTIRKIFSIGIDPQMQAAMPAFWRHYFNPRLAWGDGFEKAVIYGVPAAGDAGFSQAGLAAAVAMKKVPADETVEAEHARIKAAVGLEVVVNEDGVVKRAVIAKPVGYGLDAKAAVAVAAWEFRPARLEGKAVVSRVAVAEDFAPGVVKKP